MEYNLGHYIDSGVVGVERAEVREVMKRRMERRVARETAEVAAAAVVVVNSEGDYSEHLKEPINLKVSSTVCEARRSACIWG